MRVLTLYYTHKPGGLCTRLYRLLNSLAAAGDQVEYLCLDAPPVPLAEGVSWVRIPLFTKRRAGLVFWGCFTVWIPFFVFWRVARARPDRIVAFGAYYSSAALAASSLLRVPIVLFLRSLTFDIDRITGKPRWLRAITGLVDRVGIWGASSVICMSEAMRRGVSQFFGRELPGVLILPNDIPVRPASVPQIELPSAAQAAKSQGAALVLAAGVLDLRKNVMVLLEALEIVKRRHLSGAIHLLVAGTGPELSRLQRYAEALQLSNVTFLGWTPGIWSLLDEVALLVHPALHEGIPNVVLEAVSAGLPVLVSDIPEFAEFFTEASSRLPASHSLPWADSLGAFLTNPDFREQLFAASKRVATELSFSWEDRARGLIADV